MLISPWNKKIWNCPLIAPFFIIKNSKIFLSYLKNVVLILNIEIDLEIKNTPPSKSWLCLIDGLIVRLKKKDLVLTWLNLVAQNRIVTPIN